MKLNETRIREILMKPKLKRGNGVIGGLRYREKRKNRVKSLNRGRLFLFTKVLLFQISIFVFSDLYIFVPIRQLNLFLVFPGHTVWTEFRFFCV